MMATKWAFTMGMGIVIVMVLTVLTPMPRTPKEAWILLNHHHHSLLGRRVLRTKILMHLGTRVTNDPIIITTATAGGASRENRRSRGWQSRSAAAIRNLRSGNSRSNSSIGGAGGNGEGQHVVIGGPESRTFLIYVIGGMSFLLFLS